MLELLKEAVCNANLELVRRGIVIYNGEMSARLTEGQDMW